MKRLKVYINKHENRVRVTSPDGNHKEFSRVVMEEFLGRRLRSDELVHHIDGDTLNNDISNLKIMTPGEHTRLHCFKGGFDRNAYYRSYMSKVVGKRLCACGCGGTVLIKKNRTFPSRIRERGEVRFLPGHWAKTPGGRERLRKLQSERSN